MRKIALLGLICTLAFAVHANAQTLALQVTDPNDVPMQDVVISVGGKGSTSPPTDLSGKTFANLPQGAQPGDDIWLVLVKANQNNLMMYSPWRGKTTVPKPQGFVAVVLAARGSLSVLQNKKVIWSLVSAVNERNEFYSGGAGRAPLEYKKKTLEVIAEEAGFSALQLDSAIRSVALVDDDPRHKKQKAVYMDAYPAHGMSFREERRSEEMGMR
jgi:hypothetical protein